MQFWQFLWMKFRGAVSEKFRIWCCFDEKFGRCSTLNPYSKKKMFRAIKFNFFLAHSRCGCARTVEYNKRGEIKLACSNRTVQFTLNNFNWFCRVTFHAPCLHYLFVSIPFPPTRLNSANWSRFQFGEK